MQFLSAQHIDAVLDWDGVLRALNTAHLGPRPEGNSFFLGNADYGMLSRGVILPGSGAGLKIASIYPANSCANPPRPVEDAAFVVIDEETKSISAILEGPAITRWKTAADSALAATKLSREDSKVLLVLGAGPVARALVDAYLHIRPSIQEVLLWNRTASKLTTTCAALQAQGVNASVVNNLNFAIAKADIITSATSSNTPLIGSEFVRSGTHVDLVGGYRLDMQEAESTLLARVRIFVDDRSTSATSGDIQIPLREGLINENRIEGDLYDLCQNNYLSRKEADITVYKNSGGAHLDLVVSQYVIKKLLENKQLRM
ncbi:ornithine cyclodeaminase [Pseudomonas luteola]|uniref:ornithine cyclodeaminase family protein n=1 Tax=Pseudomonas luteola TaxID=47886 RepID=UPI000F788C5B|nr:ornithine cyclodeaminase [Pseudomonas luteola]RRW40636.1 ornithine cyclodeaminase [Pseudomonas luteola]